ncbi:MULTISPECIES: NADPH-dependent FMN reductase [unclassified Pseudomonas]|uniref:NADPH-dependent FMN reductase n=1 Tax=unclassified Pseudomonas TaxID=196821 RepID=UPI0005BAB144|nr:MULTISPECIES: NAD(P)H-dependent oxidoreductase [unclassified Pseudomonas]
MTSKKPYILGLGGTTTPGSLTEKMVRCGLAVAKEMGADTGFLGGEALRLPLYSYGLERNALAESLGEEIRRADGLIIASPGYHGAVSGMMKNALDYLEENRSDARPYLTHRAVGCIGLAAGWQAGSATLTGLRSIVHALRGWPTPLGVVVNSSEIAVDATGCISDLKIREQLIIMVGQIMQLCQVSVQK